MRFRQQPPVGGEAHVKKKIRVGALISGGGTNLQAIIDASRTGAIDADVVFVGSDNPAAKGLERARRHGISDWVVDYAAVLRACRQEPGKVRPPEDFQLEDVRAKQAIFPPSADRNSVDAGWDWLPFSALSKGTEAPSTSPRNPDMEPPLRFTFRPSIRPRSSLGG